MAMSIFMATGRSIFSRGALALKFTNPTAVRLATTTAFRDVDEGVAVDGSTNAKTSVVHSPVEAVELFYGSINDKNLEQLQSLVAEDCFFEDTFFTNQPRGKQEVMRFLERLTESMGSDLKFRVEQTAGGDGNTVGVTWHFAMRNQQVPFTKGCSFYEFSKDGEQLLIKQARAVMESVIKPGNISLAVSPYISPLLAPLFGRS